MGKPSVWETAFRKGQARAPAVWRRRQVMTGVSTVVTVGLAGAVFAYLGDAFATASYFVVFFLMVTGSTLHMHFGILRGAAEARERDQAGQAS